MTDSRDGKSNIAELTLGGLTAEEIDHKRRVYVDIVAKYYGDPDFKAKMDADPTNVLKAEGFDVREGAEVRLLCNSDSLVHVVLPMPRTAPRGGRMC